MMDRFLEGWESGDVPGKVDTGKNNTGKERISGKFFLSVSWGAFSMIDRKSRLLDPDVLTNQPIFRRDDDRIHLIADSHADD